MLKQGERRSLPTELTAETMFPRPPEPPPMLLQPHQNCQQFISLLLLLKASAS